MVQVWLQLQESSGVHTDLNLRKWRLIKACLCSSHLLCPGRPYSVHCSSRSCAQLLWHVGLAAQGSKMRLPLTDIPAILHMIQHETGCLFPVESCVSVCAIILCYL